MLSWARARRLFDIDAKSPGIEKIAGAKPDEVVGLRYRFKSLSFGGVSVVNPLIYLLPDFAEHSMKVDEGKIADDPVWGPIRDVSRFIVGTDILRKLHLYVAYREQKLYVTAASAGVSAPANAPAKP